uniref:Sterol regulatory element-binding protein ECM22 n=1 Tax=Talaromyces marneffei PM1 TaxID=1077442 RepID=A0A093V972_TALMA
MTNKVSRTRTGDLKQRRSRRGCRNCKLRKVKCDELRPHCQGCRTYGVLCNYDANVPELQLSTEARPQKLLGNGALAMRKVSRAPGPNPRVSILNTGAMGGFTVPFGLDHKRSRLLYHFRTCMAPSWRDARDGCLQLAHEYPFLMHTILAVGSAYERHLTSPPNVPSRRTFSEISNFSQSTSLLGEQLRKSIVPQAKDAIWACATLYGALLFVAVDATSPEEAWPLKDSACDLDWIPMVDSKWVLWNLLEPMRPDSIFRCLADTYADLRIDAPPNGVYGVSPLLARLCGLDEMSTAETNPYFEAVHAISQLTGPPESREYLARVLAFLSCMSQSFKALMASKDARALLLLVLWYNKAGRTVWWIEMRARVDKLAKLGVINIDERTSLTTDLTHDDLNSNNQEFQRANQAAKLVPAHDIVEQLRSRK